MVSISQNSHSEKSPAVALAIEGLVKEFKPSRDYLKKHPDKVTDEGMVRAVNGISLQAKFGEVTVLLGANGAGKTTTLACAQGLQKPTAGFIKLLGHTPWGADPELRARVGIMLQDGGLPQAMHPIPLLHHISKMYATPASVDALVERLGIDSFNGTTIRRLSGGQKQRVSLAAALIGQPEVLFLDEPSAGLDPQSRNVVFEIIEEQKQQGVAIILTTHLLDDAQKLADYVYIVNQGQNVRSGTIEELLMDSASEDKTLTFTLMGTQVTLADLLPRSASQFTMQLLEEHKYSLHGPFTPQILADLFASFNSLQRMPLAFQLAARSLEDVFLDISGRDIR